MSYWFSTHSKIQPNGTACSSPNMHLLILLHHLILLPCLCSCPSPNIFPTPSRPPENLLTVQDSSLTPLSPRSLLNVITLLFFTTHTILVVLARFCVGLCVCLSPPSLRESGALKAKAPFSSCLYHLRLVAQGLRPNRLSTNTELDCFSDETNKNSKRHENVRRATWKHVCTNVGMCCREKQRGSQ